MARKPEPGKSNSPKKPSKSKNALSPEDQIFADVLKRIEETIADGGDVEDLFSTAELFDSDSVDDDPASILLDQADEIADPDRREAAVREVLRLYPNSVDAYWFLAYDAKLPEQILNYHREAVAAGRRQISDMDFEKYRGHFWGAHETRPYMRARFQLAFTLWDQGFRDEAVAHMRDMLKLCPNDNLGVRYEIIPRLLALGNKDEVKALMNEYPDDDSAVWAYTTTLLQFAEGDLPAAKKSLTRAMKTNRHVPAYLLDFKMLPSSPPEFYSPGDETEAVIYTGGNRKLWRQTEGALEWLKNNANIKEPRPSKEKGPSAASVWKKQRKLLATLPRTDDVWQYDLVRSQSDDSGVLAGYVIDKESRQLVTICVSDEELKPQETIELFVNAMLNPKFGDAMIPARIEVCDPKIFATLQKKMSEIDLPVQLVDELPFISQLAEEAQEMVGRSEQQKSGELSLKEIAELPQAEVETWQMDARRINQRVMTENGENRPWIGIVCSLDDNTVLAQDVITEQPTQEWFLRLACGAMAFPLMGSPRRPAVLELFQESGQYDVSETLNEIGIQCEIRESLEMIDELEAGMREHLLDDDQPSGLLDSPGVQSQHGAALWQAAAEFYRARPWELVPGDLPIRIECPQFATKIWYAIIMGQTGLTFGLAIYDDEAELRRLLTEPVSDSKLQSSLVCMFGEPACIPPIDLNAAEKDQWVVAGKDAYPWFLRTLPGQGIRAPLLWELQLLEACMRGLPHFVKKRSQATSRMLMPTAEGELDILFSWAKL